MPRINKTKYAILGLLHSGPMSGYDIKKISDGSIGYFWQENYGHIYPVLKKLEKEGLAVSRKEEREGTPPRNVFTITEEGKKEFDSWFSQATEPVKFRLELLLKVFFGNYTDKNKIIAQLEQTIENNEKLLKEYSEVNNHLANQEHDKDGLRYWMFTLDFGRRYKEMENEWCRDCIKVLRNRK